MSNLRKLLVAVAGCTFLLVALFSQATADSSALAARVVLLRNGQILRGEVTPGSDRYEVAVPSGRLSVNAAEVEFCCGSLEEVYQYRRARMALATGRDHLELARWCREQGLLDRAAEALAQAEAIDPQNPFVPLLHRELELARQKAAAPPVEPKNEGRADGDRPKSRGTGVPLVKQHGQDGRATSPQPSWAEEIVGLELETAVPKPCGTRVPPVKQHGQDGRATLPDTEFRTDPDSPSLFSPRDPFDPEIFNRHFSRR